MDLRLPSPVSRLPLAECNCEISTARALGFASLPPCILLEFILRRPLCIRGDNPSFEHPSRVKPGPTAGARLAQAAASAHSSGPCSPNGRTLFASTRRVCGHNLRPMA